ncbi:uncharacterized protein Dwil_GK27002 [Drosophila willistoni]|uniref:C-type lectin domain-containing protein n=1 Tax=Drosophila willistoni TaxID=7260 RepID=A0A0Q9WRA2_DROWI|nr:C-type lectin 37Da isoform X2 [Drosophila willistoni]KRF98767.1 uncharacterized protein Dwil_GK27002 [Drosophila willistoni]
MASTVHPIDNNTNFTVYSTTKAALGPKPLFTQIGNKFYFIETEVKKNWHDAYATCRQMGAHLISLNSADERIAVTKFLQDNKIDTFYWTSGNDLRQQGNHVWFPTTDTVDVDIWYPGEPNNVAGKEHCDIYRYDIHLGLNDLKCESQERYICELPKHVN